MYVLITSESPFYYVNEFDIFKQILKAELPKSGESWQSMSVLARDLIEKLLVKNPDNRLTITNARNHDWFNK